MKKEKRCSLIIANKELLEQKKRKKNDAADDYC
jgi:hypothetical protein